MKVSHKFLILLPMIILLASVTFAQLGAPHQFYGTVDVNGNPAADGTVVSARIDGTEAARTTTLNGKYGYSPVFYVDDPNNNRVGKTVQFFVSDVNSGRTAIFSNGEPTQVNLAVSVSTPPGPSGGNGGGGGGGAPPATTQNKTNTTNQITPPTTTGSCTERWLCTDWSSCNNDNLQTRTCEDVNKCGTDDNKPVESQPCTTVATGTGNQGSSNAPFSIPPITAFIAANPALAGGAVVVILIIIYLAWRTMKKKKKQP